jgi:hypothetical protein
MTSGSRNPENDPKRERLIQNAHNVLGVDHIDRDQTVFEIGLPEPVDIETARSRFRPLLRMLCANAGLRVPTRIARSCFDTVSDRSAGTYMSQMERIRDKNRGYEGHFLRTVVGFDGSGYTRVVWAGKVPEGSEDLIATREQELSAINEKLVADSMRRRSRSRAYSKEEAEPFELPEPDSKIESRTILARWTVGFEFVQNDLEALSEGLSRLPEGIVSNDVTELITNAHESLGQIANFFSIDLHPETE